MPDTPIAPEPTTRQFYLDWLRIAAFALLVPYHVGMYYVSWDWHIKSPQWHTELEPWMQLLSPWRMDLLFIVSGAATALMLRPGPPTAAWLRSRASRLLLPLLTGMLVIVPPQSYFEVQRHYGYAGSYLDFLPLYLRSGSKGFCDAVHGCLVLPTWNHLWYLPYVFAYTLQLWGLLRLWPQALERVARAASGLTAASLLVLPVAALFASRLLLAARFPTTHALVDDWLMHLQYLGMFVFGLALARTTLLARHAERLRWVALPLALVAWLALLALQASGFGWPWLSALSFSLLQWSALLAALGFAHRHWNVDRPLRRALSEAVFPLYLLHQTLIILLARALLPFDLPFGIEAPLLVAGTLALGGLAFLAARKAGPLRPWLGLKPQARIRTSPTTASPALRSRPP